MLAIALVESYDMASTFLLIPLLVGKEDLLASLCVIWRFRLILKAIPFYVEERYQLSHGTDAKEKILIRRRNRKRSKGDRKFKYGVIIEESNTRIILAMKHAFTSNFELLHAILTGHDGTTDMKLAVSVACAVYNKHERLVSEESREEMGELCETGVSTAINGVIGCLLKQTDVPTDHHKFIAHLALMWRAGVLKSVVDEQHCWPNQVERECRGRCERQKTGAKGKEPSKISETLRKYLSILSG